MILAGRQLPDGRLLMSAYNTVEVKRLVPCRRCGDAGVIKVQFAYGDTQQYSYSMGDEIK
jgi:hypothetical protein